MDCHKSKLAAFLRHSSTVNQNHFPVEACWNSSQRLTQNTESLLIREELLLQKLSLWRWRHRRTWYGNHNGFVSLYFGGSHARKASIRSGLNLNWQVVWIIRAFSWRPQTKILLQEFWERKWPNSGWLWEQVMLQSVPELVSACKTSQANLKFGIMMM